jgi:hypothetical protein
MWRCSKHGLKGMVLRRKLLDDLWDDKAIVWLATTLF